MPSPFLPARLCPKLGIGTEWRFENCGLAEAGCKTNPNSRSSNGEDLASRISLVCVALESCERFQAQDFDFDKSSSSRIRARKAVFTRATCPARTVPSSRTDSTLRRAGQQQSGLRLAVVWAIATVAMAVSRALSIPLHSLTPDYLHHFKSFFQPLPAWPKMIPQTMKGVLKTTNRGQMEGMICPKFSYKIQSTF
jgi:hypothetical protein